MQTAVPLEPPVKRVQDSTEARIPGKWDTQHIAVPAPQIRAPCKKCWKWRVGFHVLGQVGFSGEKTCDTLHIGRDAHQCGFSCAWPSSEVAFLRKKPVLDSNL